MGLLHQSLNSSGKGWSPLSPPLDEILRIISELPLKEALTFLAVNGIVQYSKKGYSRIKQIIQDKHNEGRYAFVPNKEEANRLVTFGKNPNFQEVAMLVPKYRNLDLIRTGLLIDYYHKNDTPDHRERVAQIKQEISQRPNGRRLLKIVNLPTTPFFSMILQFLFVLKSRGYASPFLEEMFEELVDDWEINSKHVKTSDTAEEIVAFCKRQIEERNILFCILGMRRASKIVDLALTELEADKQLLKNDYSYRISKSLEGNNPRTEIMFYKNPT